MNEINRRTEQERPAAAPPASQQSALADPIIVPVPQDYAHEQVAAERGQVASEGRAREAAALTGASARTALSSEQGTSAPADGVEGRLVLHEERLRPRPEEYQAGVVRVTKRVEERTVVLEAPVREEWVVVEVSDAAEGIVRFDGRDLQPGEVIEIPVFREEVRLERQTLVASEVQIRKEQVTRQERVSGTVKAERLAVDDDLGVVRDSHGWAAPTAGGLTANEWIAGSTDVQPGMSVFGTSGDVIGTVKEVEADRFKLDAPLRPDYWLPFSAITEASSGAIRVDETRKDNG